MIDPKTYHDNELLAKSLLPSWRISRIHNVDVFEAVGFPVRISSFRELRPILDTMQENRFDPYIEEWDGLTQDEHDLMLKACHDIVDFQVIYLPYFLPILPLSTLISSLSIYRKMLSYNLKFKSVLEIGPGCGYLSFFLRHHTELVNYSQIEACESFYILQNLINVHCFGARFDEDCIRSVDDREPDYFTNPRAFQEFSAPLQLSSVSPKCTHYPWWNIGKVLARGMRFDVVTANACLLEFSQDALDDYLTLLHKALNPQGIFLMQCTGEPTHTSPDDLYSKLFEKGFAPLILVSGEKYYSPPGLTAPDLVSRLKSGDSRKKKKFVTPNAAFVKQGHPLFDKYFDEKNYRGGFIAPEKEIDRIYFRRPRERKHYTKQHFIDVIEQTYLSSSAS